jgi:5-methyltetrahydropteroyltriglutamate--homocysteine methyltransferase
MASGTNIKTTTVGSYPIPSWLVAAPSEQALLDATRVVIATQEHAGIDLVCDGELYRFDINHPETNGMIEYFVKPMTGVRTSIGFDELLEYRAQPGMRFRTRPPAVVDAPLGSGTLNLPDACARAKAISNRPLKFTVTGPHMLAKTVLNKHYKSTPDLCMAVADVLAQQVRHINADVVQLDEANLPGHPEEWEWAAAAINRVLDVGELAVFKDLRPEIGMGLGVIDVKRTEVEKPDDVARAIEQAERAMGIGRIRYVHPDCGFWMLSRTIADGKIRSLVQERDLFEGRPKKVAATAYAA